MYIPKYFQNNDAATVQSFIRENGFGILVSSTSGQVMASHIPMILSEDAQTLTGHLSRANKQSQFLPGEEVLTIFQGPHAYVSSSWYNHENVPTWNYIAVHVYGTIRIVEGEELYMSLKDLTDKYEKDSANPVSMDTLSAEYLQRSMRGVTGFEITISRIEAAYKLSQNRDEESYNSVIRELEKKNDAGSREIAARMKANPK